MKRHITISLISALTIALAAGYFANGRGLSPINAYALQTVTSAAEQIYTCPMHPEIRVKNPGKCPICGMTLAPVENPKSLKDTTPASARSQVEQYACPMKCEGEKTYDQPGKCPVCNMNLEKITPPSTSKGK